MNALICPNFDICGGSGNSNEKTKGLKHRVIGSCPSKNSFLFILFYLVLTIWIFFFEVNASSHVSSLHTSMSRSSNLTSSPMQRLSLSVNQTSLNGSIQPLVHQTLHETNNFNLSLIDKTIDTTSQSELKGKLFFLNT